MQFENIALIAALEIAAVLLIFCVILAVQNRSLRKLIKKLQGRMTELVEELKLAQSNKSGHVVENSGVSSESFSYSDYVDEQIKNTKQHHASLSPDRDIALDLAPDTAIPRRSAALRHAVLLAEKEAVTLELESDDSTNWSILRKKYQQIFDFYEDYTAESAISVDNEEINTLNQELTNSKKRINSLEKFKALYFDLEAKWEAAREKAQSSYKDFNKMASEVADEAKFKRLLDEYRASYDEVDTIIVQGTGGADNTETTHVEVSDSSGELRHLRAVAADQHQIIADLQSQLEAAKTEDDKDIIVERLKSELDKQLAFIKESETCIQLMEDELQTKCRELDQLTGRLDTVPTMKSQLQELRKQNEEYEIKVNSLTSDNRKLSKKLQDEKGSTFADTGEVSKLKKEVVDLEMRYANLEEKYLDLKLNQ